MVIMVEKAHAASYQILGNACFARADNLQTRRAGRGYGYKWISGPITTVQDGHIVPKATAVTRVGSAAQQWFSESSGSGIVVLGNQPISVGWNGTDGFSI
jgi:hypothetical protein